MPLNLHLLRIFTAVVEYGGFSQAAKTLYISQPAASKGVQELERQLDMPLFRRGGRGPDLTEPGRVLYGYAKQIFGTERAAETALEQIRSLEQGHLNIGASNTVGTFLLPPILGAFHKQYPGIRLSLNIGNTQQIVDLLRNVPLDMAFVEGPVDGTDLVITPWLVDTLVPIAPLDSPFVNEQPVTLERFLQHPFIFREVGSGTREIIQSLINQRGLKLNVAMELGSNQAVKEAVSAGLGVAIVSAATIRLELAAGTLTAVTITDFDLQRTLTQIYLNGQPPSFALKAFQRWL